MSRIERVLEVNASIEQCYRTLYNVNEYACFLPNVEQIRPKGDPDVWQWRLIGPNNLKLQWDMQMVGHRHNPKILSWHTIREADVVHSGAITLEAMDSNRTRLHLVVEYKPSAYVISELGEDEIASFAESMLDNGLACFKALMEEVRPVAAGQEQTIRDITES